MTTKNNVNDAASIVLASELKALVALAKALNVFDVSLAAIQDVLPSNLTLDAARIINEMRSQHSYRQSTELPALLSRYTSAVTPVEPEVTPDA